MKNAIISAVLIISTLLFAPLWTISQKQSRVLAESESLSVSTGKVAFKESQSFKIKLSDGTIKELPVLEYITGVVAAEMPALYETEALKAQAVAAYTFALYKKFSSKEEYDLTADYHLDQAYLSKDELKERWGESYSQYYDKISSAVKEVGGEYLCYKDEIALTVYHAISSGKTNPSEEVWGKDLPYLSSVESIGDKLSKDYISTVTFTEENLNQALSTTSGGFGEVQKNNSGYVKKISYGGKEFTGNQVQKVLSLRSCAFDVTKGDGGYTFTVYGYGHGVGMSQTGADYMAKQGSSYKEILYWYYKGTQIKK